MVAPRFTSRSTRRRWSEGATRAGSKRWRRWACSCRWGSSRARARSSARRRSRRGLAPAVLALRPAPRGVDLGADGAPRIARVSADEGGGAGDALIHEPVLRALFPHPDARGRQAHREFARGGGAGRSVLYRLWRALRPRGAKAAHRGRMSPRGAPLFSDLLRLIALRVPGAESAGGHMPIDGERAGMTMTFTREKLELPAGKGRLLLHSCCAPCSGEVMEAIQASGIEYAICASSGRPCTRTSTAST